MAAEAEENLGERYLDEPPDSVHDVAVGVAGEKDHNTIVLGGATLVIPLELDMDGDPFQDDAVCLRNVDGFWEDVRLSSDPEVTASRDKRHLYYKFQNVPAGVYEVDAMIGGEWTTVLRGLLVSKGVGWLNEKQLGEEEPSEQIAVDDPHLLVKAEQADAAPEPKADDCGCGH